MKIFQVKSGVETRFLSTFFHLTCSISGEQVGAEGGGEIISPTLCRPLHLHPTKTRPLTPAGLLLGLIKIREAAVGNFLLSPHSF